MKFTQEFNNPTLIWCFLKTKDSIAYHSFPRPKADITIEAWTRSTSQTDCINRPTTDTDVAIVNLSYCFVFFLAKFVKVAN